LSRHFGASLLFVAASIPTAASLIAMALSSQVLLIALARAGVGISYAVASIACQEYALRSGDNAGASRSSGTFLAMIYGGTFSGSVLGGVLAQHFGYPVALASGALLALTGGAIGYVTMSVGAVRPPRASTDAPQGSTPNARRRYIAITMGLAIPLNLVTAVYVWYLAPLRLTAMGATASETARAIMLYYLAQILLGGMIANVSRRIRWRWLALAAGAAVAAGALTTLGILQSLPSLFLGMALLGIGHALLRGPILALVTELAQSAGSSLSAFRVAERLGALTGLLLTTVALAQMPASTIYFALATLVILGFFIAAAVEWTPAASRR